LAVAIANLADTIATCLESKQYPSLLPDELVTELERTTAKEALELTDKIEFVEMEAFIQNNRDIDLCADFFQGEESHNVNWKVEGFMSNLFFQGTCFANGCEPEELSKSVSPSFANPTRCEI